MSHLLPVGFKNNNCIWRGSKYDDSRPLPDNSAFLADISEAGGGGDPAIYSLYKTTDTTEIIRLLRKDDCAPNTIIDNIVQSINFDGEDSKRQYSLNISSERVRLYDNGTYDSATITGQIYDGDNNEDNTYNGTLRTIAYSPSGVEYFYDMVFTNGSYSFLFKPNEHGLYKIGETKCLDDSFEEFRALAIGENLGLQIDVYYQAE